MYSNSTTRAQEAVLKQDLKEMREAIDAYHADKNKWPVAIEALATEKYIRAVPVDPITNAMDWTTTASEPDPTNPLDEPGISDVHSASDRTSPFTQTPYSEW
jgi:general secretion pathway protein G